jgi:diguanylate cyclase (GGDEF)-like protein
MFNLLPIAQGLLLDSIPDPVVVLDAARHIVAHNPAARELMGGRALNGLPLAAMPELHQALTATPAPSTSVAIGSPARHFDLGQVPLSYAGREVGRLIQMRDITHRKAIEADLVRQLASNQALQKQLREEAIRDALTGLHNRRFFSELSPTLMAEAQRQNAPLAAAMIDIDHFKRLNDTHGHAAGDAVLRATGTFLRASIRQSDMVFRMGGEEFLVLLPRTPGDQALKRVDEWRAAFAAQRIMFETAALTATFSAGVAVFPGDAADIDTLLSHADRALYGAKMGGRNRTEGWRAR